MAKYKSIRAFEIANASPGSIFSERSPSLSSLFTMPRCSDSNCPTEWTGSAGSASIDGGVSFRGFQAWIYYPTWTRLDPLVFGVVLAAIEKFRPNWWQRLINSAPWLWLPAVRLIIYALYLGETENLTVAACVWQFPFVAWGWAHSLCARSAHDSRFVESQFPAPAFIASIAYSAYLIQKLIIKAVEQFCINHGIDLTSVPALLAVENLRVHSRNDSFPVGGTSVPASSSKACTLQVK